MHNNTTLQRLLLMLKNAYKREKKNKPCIFNQNNRWDQIILYQRYLWNTIFHKKSKPLKFFENNFRTQGNIFICTTLSSNKSPLYSFFKTPKLNYRAKYFYWSWGGGGKLCSWHLLTFAFSPYRGLRIS